MIQSHYLGLHSCCSPIKLCNVLYENVCAAKAPVNDIPPLDVYYALLIKRVFTSVLWKVFVAKFAPERLNNITVKDVKNSVCDFTQHILAWRGIVYEKREGNSITQIEEAFV